jgi:hypothetical protein
LILSLRREATTSLLRPIAVSIRTYALAAIISSSG